MIHLYVLFYIWKLQKGLYRNVLSRFIIFINCHTYIIDTILPFAAIESSSTSVPFLYVLTQNCRQFAGTTNPMSTSVFFSPQHSFLIVSCLVYQIISYIALVFKLAKAGKQVCFFHLTHLIEACFFFYY